ncbi:hypothetical protein BJD12_00260 [Xanthomonas vesicatoria ATCC 35937]|uniref:Uncharacterized protein n=1 Tax=Xanthomonas vesicatoria ATCC 35937 TaxID=925775 RepID=F0B8Z4_9XANT|nr:hypothetical protein [Xanthomonas vesicatoria]APP73948.1 hypothetical protein BJD12_00260 [Xanthomonas vesicatoria ATCC 35937]EGD11114.1 hypothetical protein XVE_0546 [Xanthomonas vesicatoria ATCC 35937]KTF31454.1 hypothetical protein LMG920_16135 [Xanthomonas vesicatoria]MCC8598125.1 hypothetical protein [Xanthomonas vesicatoria]MCC8606144.1 hypothetical protein [Xanthomonas vesicatoria]
MTSNSKPQAHIFSCFSPEKENPIALVVVPTNPADAEVLDPTKASEKQIKSRFSLVQNDLEEAQKALENIPPMATSFHKSLVAYFDIASGAKVIEFYWFDASKKRHLLTYQVWMRENFVEFQQTQSLISATGVAQNLGAEIVSEKSRLDASVSVSRKSSLSGLDGKKR